MWKFVDKILSSFRNCFSRKAAFDWFYTVVIGFMIRSDKLGVTSVIRDLNLKETCYEKIIHLFHASSWDLNQLCHHWYSLVNSLSVAYLHNDMHIFIIDGVKQSKEGHYMPGVKKMANDSDTQSKPQTMHGHMAGMLSLLVGKGERIAALPMKMTIQDGVKEMCNWEGSNVSGESHISQMFTMTSEAVNAFQKKAVVLADRLFLTVTALEKIFQHNQTSSYRLDLVTKCKKNVVAYSAPRKNTGRGRPRKKGDAIHLNDRFKNLDTFLSGEMILYGKKTTVRYFCIDLLWGHGKLYPLRFVLVSYDNVTSILATTALDMAPKDIILLYSFRFRIEHLFRSLKQYYGGFSYHFWTTAMPRLNRFRTKDSPDPLKTITSLRDRKRIISALRATEMYMFISNIAIGISMILSIRYDFDSIQLRYQRTPAKKKPSEDNVMYYLRKQFPAFLSSKAFSSENCILLANQADLK